MPPRFRWIGKISRDSVLFVCGIAGVAHETLSSQKVERPELLIVFAGMMGLPAFLRLDERRHRNDEDEDDSKPRRSPK